MHPIWWSRLWCFWGFASCWWASNDFTSLWSVELAKSSCTFDSRNHDQLVVLILARSTIKTHPLDVSRCVWWQAYRCEQAMAEGLFGVAFDLSICPRSSWLAMASAPKGQAVRCCFRSRVPGALWGGPYPLSSVSIPGMWIMLEMFIETRRKIASVGIDSHHGRRCGTRWHPGGLQYMVFPDRLDIIPSVSMLPSKEAAEPEKTTGWRWW